MAITQNLEILITPEQQGSYFTLPFTMPPDMETFTLAYHYERHRLSPDPLSGFCARHEVNIIDLGLIAPDGSQVGASGSDKTCFTLSATSATPGYRPGPLTPGTWQIIVGAYKVVPEGVKVSYELGFIPKQRRLFKGDLHTHTVASDGVLTAGELGWHALRHDLDFVAITDHNQLVSAASLPAIPGFTFIPGVEWTHYNGHVNFLGVDEPYSTPFISNTLEEVVTRFQTARSRGALTVVNHPQDESCGFQYDLNILPFDCLEIWNGPMREANLRAVGLWQSLLAAGKKIPAVGGSDYHRDNPFQILGGPTMGVYALSASPADILAAVKAGHAFITFFPGGPTLALTCGEALMGDSLPWQAGLQVRVAAEGLMRGDVLRLVSAQGSTVLLQAPENGNFENTYDVPGPGFFRVEILRAFLPGLPLLPALISNPIFFDEPQLRAF
ncbi:MAG TPA: CehA/McbA family metallohydrolase [Anaerolineaceae bacterium]|nr:CehA/McbA family metallohydrolase [Anaerolineaceae bacterium]HPN54020.1 CehA/McbA family metallohydrolase [Anaerolineaceae bacterium]